MGQPLADRIRPAALSEVVGQKHILGPDKALRRIIESGQVPNMVFTGLPAWAKPQWPPLSPKIRTGTW